MALQQFIHVPWDYLGIMGSPAKIEHLFAGLRQQGVAETAIQTVRAPIGIPINSHTAEEIAISIAADLIRHKNMDGSAPEKPFCLECGVELQAERRTRTGTTT